MSEAVLPPGAAIRATVQSVGLANLLAKVTSLASGVPKGLGLAMVRVDAVPAGESASHLALTLKAHDLTFTGTVPATVEEAGSFLTPATDFANYQKRASGPVEFTALDAGRVSMRAGRTQWTLHAEYPDVLERPERRVLSLATVNGDDFRDAIRATLPALPPSSGRPALQRVRIDRDGATATDGSLLVRQAIPNIGKITTALTVPVARILQGATCHDFIFRQDALGVDITADSFTLRIVEGAIEYPDVSRIVQAAGIEGGGLMLVDSKTMAEALARVRALSDAANAAVTVRTFQPTQRPVWQTVLACEDRSGATAREVADVSWQEGYRLDATFNHRHLERIISALGPGEYSWRIGDSSLMVEDLDRGLVAVARQIVT